MTSALLVSITNCLKHLRLLLSFISAGIPSCSINYDHIICRKTVDPEMKTLGFDTHTHQTIGTTEANSCRSLLRQSFHKTIT